MTIRSEKDLRRALRSLAAASAGRLAPLVFIEPARGGSIGAPDAFLGVSGCGFAALELKIVARASSEAAGGHLAAPGGRGSGGRAKAIGGLARLAYALLRPSQKAFFRAARAGGAPAFLLFAVRGGTAVFIDDGTKCTEIRHAEDLFRVLSGG